MNQSDREALIERVKAFEKALHSKHRMSANIYLSGGTLTSEDLRALIALASPSPAQTETGAKREKRKAVAAGHRLAGRIGAVFVEHPSPAHSSADGDLAATTPQPGEGRAGSPAQWPEDVVERMAKALWRENTWQRYQELARAALATLPPPETFQARVAPWMAECFGPEISADKLERNDRFIEEALELIQASGYTAERAHALVDYTFNRPQGEINQEVGGVMVTLAAHCLAHGVDMHEAAETELARIWTKMEQIRAKHATKPKHSAIPVPLPPPDVPTTWQHVAGLCAEIGGLRQALDAANIELADYAKTVGNLRSQVSAPPEDERVKGLETALKPFADLADKIAPGVADYSRAYVSGLMGDYYIEMEDIRRAASALASYRGGA